MTLFEECIEALSKDAEILTNEESRAITKEFQIVFPFDNMGRIVWEDVSEKSIVDDIHNISISETLKEDTGVYIIWDDMNYPVVKSILSAVINKIDDVVAVSFDTWLYCKSAGMVIGFYHEGEITIGKTKANIHIVINKYKSPRI